MKKLNITGEKLATIAFTCIVWLCVLIAAAFALQGNNTYTSALSAIGYLALAAFFEWMKYKVIQYHHEQEKECNDITQG